MRCGLNLMATKLRSLASKCGGGHLTLKETEEILESYADEISGIAEAIRKASYRFDEDMIKLTGVENSYLSIVLREENIKMHRRKMEETTR